MAYYVGDALSEIKKIKATDDGHLDMDTLPSFAKKMTKRLIVDNERTEVPGRDIGAMVSMLTVAVQQLTARIEELEKK